MNDINPKYIQAIKWKQSPEKTASRLKISVEEFLAIKLKYNEMKKQSKINNLKDKIISSKYNKEKGTGIIEGILVNEPLSAEEIEIKFKVDTKNWRLSEYWNKEKRGGGYFVSAKVVKVSDVIVEKDFVSSIQNILNSNIEYIRYDQKINNNKKALFIYLSDKHIGAYVSSKAIFDNKYDKLIFKDRMDKVVEEIKYLVNLYGAFKDIFIIDLGDSVDGQNAQTTRGGHKLPQNMTNREVFETYLTVHKEFYDKIFTSNFASDYHLYNVTISNHGGDFEYYTSKSMELYIKTRYPFVHTRILEKFIEHFKYGIHTFILTHGKDDEDMKFGFPLLLNDKVELMINRYIDYHNLGCKNIHFIKADLHQENNQNASKFRYKNTLSLFGTSKWMMNNFLVSGKGGCSMEIVEESSPRVYQTNITF